MEYRDYYAALGVDKKASQADIKKAFRKLAREHHPDVNKGDAAAERRFKEISEANEVLSDPEKRKAYDQLGADWAAYQRAGAGTSANPFAGFAGAAGAAGAPGGVRFEFHGSQQDLSGFSDFFRTFFGGAGGSAGHAGSGRVDLDSLFGGLGGDAAGGPVPPGFGAAGRGNGPDVGGPRMHASARAEISLEEVLSGTVRHLEVGGKRLEVKIPAGVRDGQRIRLSGKAEGGGNIYITVHVKRHPRFRREDADLLMDLPLTLGEALLGAEVSLQALGGKKLLLSIPPATQNGRVFRLSGQGLPRFGSDSRGDLRVRTSIVMPSSLDAEAEVKARALIDHIDQPDPRAATAAGTR